MAPRIVPTTSIADFRWVNPFAESQALNAHAQRYLSSSKLPLYRSLQAGHKTPLILIPGLASSRLYAKYTQHTTPKCCFVPAVPLTPCNATSRKIQDSWEQVWASAWGVSRNDCWRDLLRMGYSDGKFTEPEHVEKTAWRTENIDASGRFVITPDFGDVKGCADLLTVGGALHPSAAWVFRNLIDFVEKTKGYTPTESVFGAPYDFTKISNSEYMFSYYYRLKLMIEYAFELNGGKPVVIVSHSLGCPVTNTFFNLYLPTVMSSVQAASMWKTTFVRLWIPVGGPFAGAFKACRAIMKGDGLGMDATCLTDCTAWYNEFQYLISGLVWMTPDSEVFENARACVITEGASSQSFSASISSLVDMYWYAGKARTGVAYVTNTQPLSAYVKAAPGVPVHVVTSSCTHKGGTEGSQIYTRYRNTGKFSDDFTVECVDERDSYTAMFAGSAATRLQYEIRDGIAVQDMIGDGTVPYMSLMVPRTWKVGGSNPNADANGRPLPVTFTHWIGGQEVEHKDILANPALLSLVADSLD